MRFADSRLVEGMEVRRIWGLKELNMELRREVGEGGLPDWGSAGAVGSALRKGKMLMSITL